MESINKTIESLENQIEKNLVIKKEIKYKRAKLIKLTQRPEDPEPGYLFLDPIENIYSNLNSHDLGRNLVSLSIPSDKLEFYYYNCESTRDFGWGCAWRCVQTILGTLRNIILTDEKFDNILHNFHNLINFDNRFETLFHSYGDKELLLNLFQNSYKLETLPDYIFSKEFAPFETEHGWGEPFLTKLILHDFGISGDLFLVNRYMETSYAPVEVFNRTINYKEFREYLLSHFSQEHKLPIVIDDTLFTFCIIGACQDSNDPEILHLLIADPHIDKPENAPNGIYHVTLNKEGDFDLEKNKHPNINGKRFKFSNGSFMVYVPYTPKC
jgi:hypothetical protein